MIGWERIQGGKANLKSDVVNSGCVHGGGYSRRSGFIHGQQRLLGFVFGPRDQGALQTHSCQTKFITYVCSEWAVEFTECDATVHNYISFFENFDDVICVDFILAVDREVTSYEVADLRCRCVVWIFIDQDNLEYKTKHFIIDRL